MDWTNPTASKSVKEREVEMSSLAAGFAAWLCKRATNAQGEATPGSKGLNGKRSRLSDPEKETQKSPAIIAVDSSKRAPDGVLALGGSDQGALDEASATLEDQAPTEGSPNADQVLREAPLEAAADQAFLAKLTMVDPCRARMVYRLALSSYVQPMEWDHPSVDAPIPSPKVSQSIIDRWAPFN